MAEGAPIMAGTAHAAGPTTAAAVARRWGGWFSRGGGRAAVGLDVGSRAVKAVQVERTPAGGVRVVAASTGPRAESPDGSACATVDGAGAMPTASTTADDGAGGAVSAGEAVAVVSALAAAGFRGRSAVLAAPADAVMIGPLELPPRTSHAPLDQIARLEVARNFRCPPDSFELAWWEVPSGGARGRGTHALAAGLPHARADALLDAFERSAKWDVRALDVGPAALVRACGPALSPHGITAILDLGGGPATLSLVYGGVLTFSRRIPEGAAGPLHAGFCRALAVDAEVADYLLAQVGLDLHPAARMPARRADEPADGSEGDDADEPIELPDAGRRLVLTYADTLVKELSLSFSYACNQYPDAVVAKLLLVGGGASLAGLAERLAAALQVETSPVAPTDLAECDPGLLSLCASPAMTLALGLALHEAA